MQYSKMFPHDDTVHNTRRFDVDGTLVGGTFRVYCCKGISCSVVETRLLLNSSVRCDCRLKLVLVHLAPRRWWMLRWWSMYWGELTIEPPLILFGNSRLEKIQVYEYSDLFYPVNTFWICRHSYL